MESQRVPVELDPKLALDLLARVEFGRAAFLADGVPTIRPLNHVDTPSARAASTKGSSRTTSVEARTTRTTRGV